MVKIIVTTNTPSTMPIVVFQMKEAEAQQIDSSLPSLNNSSFLSLFIFDKDGTKVYTGQKESLVPIPQVQVEAQKVVKEDDKFEELKVTIALEEQLTI